MKNRLVLLFLVVLISCFSQTKMKVKNQIIVFIGASESSGYGLSKGLSYVDKFSRLIEQDDLQFIIKNISYPGAATANGIEMFNSILNNKDTIHSVFISLGLSDVVYGVNPEQIYKNLSNMVELIQSKSIETRIYIMEGEIFQYHALPNLPTHETDYYKEYKKIYKRLEKGKKIIIYPFLMKPFLKKPEYFLPDLVHPNEKGTTKMSKIIYALFNESN